MSCPIKFFSMSCDSHCPLTPVNLVKALNCKYLRWTAVAAAVGYTAFTLNGMRKKAALKAEQKNLKKDVVYLYSFPRSSVYNIISMPCMKVEILLRLNNIPYTFVPKMDPSESPTGRFPYIVHNGEAVADSEAIVQYLVKEFNIGQELTHEQKHKGQLVRRVYDNMLVCVERGMMVDNRPLLRQLVADEFRPLLGIPTFMVDFITDQFRKDIIKFLNNHGNGDVPQETYLQDFLDDVKALEYVLTNSGGFAVGDKPSQYDASLYACLQMSLACARNGAVNVPAFEFVKNSAVLTKYCDTMAANIYPDLASLCGPNARLTFNQ